MILGIVNTKGGVGKTTSAVYLATALSRQDKPVVVVDLDQQGSASDWHDRAEAAGSPLPFRVEVSNVRRLPKTLGLEAPGTFVILDTPPGNDSIIQATIQASDFVVVPTQASPIEVARVWETLPSLSETPHGVLLTSARLGTRQLDDATEALRLNKTPVFDTWIPIRNSIRGSFGSTPEQLHGYEVVVQEIMEAMAWA